MDGNKRAASICTPPECTRRQRFCITRSAPPTSTQTHEDRARRKEAPDRSFTPQRHERADVCVRVRGGGGTTSGHIEPRVTDSSYVRQPLDYKAVGLSHDISPGTFCGLDSVCECCCHEDPQTRRSRRTGFFLLKTCSHLGSMLCSRDENVR